MQDYSRSSQYQYEANARMAMPWDGNGAVDNPITDFYREHKECIDTTIRTVQKGRNISGSWNICDSKRNKRFDWKVIRDKRNVPTRMEDYI